MSSGETQPLLASTERGGRKEQTKAAHEKHAQAFGKQTITTAGSFVLNINNLIGPALVTFPLVYKNAGWFSVSLALVVFSSLTAVSATMMVEAMQRIPGNKFFNKRYEFANVMKHYWGKKGFIIGQLLVNLCLQSSNIASIIVSAQVLDDLLIFAFGHTYGLHFAPPNAGFIASSGSADSDHPFGKMNWIVSLGYVIAAAICIPFGYLNLDQNMGFQWFSCIGMCATILEFIVQFFLRPWHPEYIPMFGNVPGFKSQALVVGTVIFSCAFTITIPSWANEKQPHVSVNKSVWSSAILSMIMKIAFAYLAAITYRNDNNSDNILSVIASNGHGAMGIVTRISIYLFNATTILPGIPPLSIFVRYNLITGGICGPKLAFFIGVVSPWLVSMFFYTGRGLSSVVNWTAILLQGFVNFVIPILLYYWAVRWYPTDDELQRMGMDRATYEAKYPHPNYELDFDSSSSSSSPSHPVPDDSTASTDPHTTFTQHSAIAEPEAQKPKSDGEEEQPLHLHNLTHSHPHKLRFHFFSSINANTSDLEIGRRSQEVEEKDEDRDEDEAERRMERDNEKKSMAVKKKKYEKKSKKSKLNVVRALPCPSALSRKFFALVFAGFLLLCVLLTLVLDFYYLIVFHDDVVDN